MKTSAFTKAAVLAASLVAGGEAAAASNWTESAYHACTVGLGNATGTQSGWRATGGTAVISCPIQRKLGSANLNNLYARIKRANGSGAAPFCTLTSYNNYSTATSSKSKFASAGAGNKSLSLPLPTIYYSGYLGLVCVLNSNDVLYGYRWGQD
ncbi:MAG: hypothetical protein AAGI15_00185 [Pseudomonadota bacterium]